jgi:hypothetical protein
MIHAGKFALLLLLTSVIWISVAAFSAGAYDRELVFQEELTIDGSEYHLVQTSSMNAKVLFWTIRICELGHYAQADAIARGVTEEDLLTSDDISKILEMRFLKKVKPSKMQRLFKEIFDSAAERKGHKVADEDLKNFMGLLRGADKGASLLLVRDPGGALRLVYDGETAGSMSSVGLCTALWSALIP